jgi:hypothetical protein
MRDEPLALPHAGHDDIDDAGRQSGLLGGLREHVARKGVLDRRLEDHRAARGQGGRRLLRAQCERPVERRDRGDDTDGLAQHQRAGRGADALLLEGIRLAEVGVCPEVDRRHRRHVSLGEGDRVAVLVDPEFGELVRAAVEPVGEAA